MVSWWFFFWLKLKGEFTLFSYGAPTSDEAASMISISLCFIEEKSDHVAVSPVAACTPKKKQTLISLR
ncbi:hypothetical protein ERO13_D09G221900v2 [Gossypium hirsutum]|nr:hypothetical protein ERO13_D09G221900v2 [Gossypium hirsutum]